jgi:hypothetical protein
MHECIHFKEFMNEQYDMIVKHIEKHKMYRKIKDNDEAVQSFINDYAWCFREGYCRGCPDHQECIIYDNLKKGAKI